MQRKKSPKLGKARSKQKTKKIVKQADHVLDDRRQDQENVETIKESGSNNAEATRFIKVTARIRPLLESEKNQ